MSYNVTRAKALKIDAKIRLSDLLLLAKETIPENSLVNVYKKRKPDAEGFIRLDGLQWTGEWSGHSLGVYERALALLVGTAEIVLIWEGGECFSGYRVDNGVVTRCEVELALGQVTT